jgi:hypothetical protein
MILKSLFQAVCYLGLLQKLRANTTCLWSQLRYLSLALCLKDRSLGQVKLWRMASGRLARKEKLQRGKKVVALKDI